MAGGCFGICLGTICASCVRMVGHLAMHFERFDAFGGAHYFVSQLVARRAKNSELRCFNCLLHAPLHMPEVDHWRLFIALPIPESIRREIAGIQDELRKALSEQAVRWTRPEQFHLTLRFFGD